MNTNKEGTIMAGREPVKYEYHGEMFSMRELSEMSGICETTLRKRIANGHTMNDAIDNHEELLKLAKEKQLANLRNHGGRKKKEAYINGSGYPDPIAGEAIMNNMAESNKRRAAKKEAYTNASGYNDPTAGEAIMNNMADYMNEAVEESNSRKIGDRTVEVNDIWYSKKGGKQYFVRECYDKYCIVYDVIDPELVAKDIFPYVDLNLRENNIGIFYTRPSFMWYSNLSKYRFTLTESCVTDQDWNLLHHASKIRYRQRIADLQLEVIALKKSNETLKQALLDGERSGDKQRIEELELANGSLGDELIQTIERCNKYRIENEQLHAELENAPNKNGDATELEPVMDVTVDKLRMELEVNKRVYQEAIAWLLSVLR